MKIRTWLTYYEVSKEHLDQHRLVVVAVIGLDYLTHTMVLSNPGLSSETADKKN